MHFLRNFWCVVMLTCMHVVSGCCGPLCQQLEGSSTLEDHDDLFTGGGIDPLFVDLPFDQGYASLCVQGAGGTTSHRATSTRYDIDLDTPNDRHDVVFAPVSGTAYVHDQDPSRNFGIHINIDQGDGTYVIIAHLHTAFVANGSPVAAGQLLGFEGTTGNSSGDHVHFGRHDGDASLDGIYGESIDGLVISAFRHDVHVQLSPDEMYCDLPNGDVYTSRLRTPRWHPNGSLVKTPDSSTVYLLEAQGLTAFDTEEAFVSRNYDFADVTLISKSEFDCYYRNHSLSNPTSITAVYGAGINEGVWLLIGSEAEEESVRYSLRVPTLGWQAVLKSWGIHASTYDDLLHDVDIGGLVRNYQNRGTATFRNGSFISPVGDSAVYVMTDDIAMPIETWDTLLFAGWENQNVIQVADSEFETVVTVKGDCRTNIHCLSYEDVSTCGGQPQETEGVNQQIAEGDELVLTWFTPDHHNVDSITLTGALTRPGLVEDDWGSVFNEVQNASLASVSLPDVESGDSLRFSVQYRDDGVPNWSCVAPYPPGLMQGTVMVEYHGNYLPVDTVADPVSAGCGLRVIVP